MCKLFNTLEGGCGVENNQRLDEYAHAHAFNHTLLICSVLTTSLLERVRGLWLRRPIAEAVDQATGSN